ncbi:MAG: ThiF family adenylyltransferase [Hyphomicrobiaceae bacterium]
MTVSFDYATFTTRNIGFVTEAEQEKLKAGKVFICGTGGMGGAALMALARAGIGHFIIADLDAFEVSNLNRQVFAFTDTVDRHKAEASAELMRKINPNVVVEVLKSDWSKEIERISREVQVIVNGTDDLAASLLLYRKARAAGLSVVDAYASPLPSVYVTGPGDAAPEERLGYPTIGTQWDAVTAEQRAAAFQAEAIHVLVHSTSRKYIDLDAAGEVAAGKRSRMSFAPMVITTGMLMAYEVIALLLAKPTGTDNRGYFFNPYRPAVERPRAWIVEAAMKPIVRQFLNRMMRAS